MDSADKKTIKIPFQITVGEFASRLDLDIATVIKKLMENGIIATINETIDYETAVIIAQELGFETEPDQVLSDKDVVTLEKLRDILRLEKEQKSKLDPRPPIVTILGHVDHGKTTLLDTLRKTRIAEKESGGITQHINAYQVKKKDRLITFIDTPGHEAFQAMRERGASIADIAVLVVAADDGVKPQTREVVKFILENKIPAVVAINKIDKPEANSNKVKQELAEIGFLLEGYGGEIPFNEISAKNNVGLDELLDTVLLVADIHNFQSVQDREALGIVLEAHKSPGKGPLATILIKTGTLKVGQDVMVGSIEGRIRKIEDYAGNSIPRALPSMPVTIVGLSDVPKSNDVLQIKKGKLDKKRRRLIQEIASQKISKPGAISSKEMIQNIDQYLGKKYSLVLKSDTQGTLEAIKQILASIESSEITLDIIREGVGPITETDIHSAQTNNATVYGFNVFPTSVAKRLSESFKIKTKTFSIIYELIEDIKSEMSEMLEPEIKRIDIGRLKLLAVFKNTKKGMVVGGKVMNGKIIKGEKVDILREKEPIGTGSIVQLQHNKQDVGEVKEGLECGLAYEGKEKASAGDVLLCYKEDKIKRKI